MTTPQGVCKENFLSSEQSRDKQKYNSAWGL